MFSEQALRWMVGAVAFFIAMRCLLSLSGLLREHLKQLLVNHVKKQQIELLKKQRIREFREKIRAKKSSDASPKGTSRAA
jgi:hypothetical protein